MTEPTEVLCTYTKGTYAFGINMADFKQVFIPTSIASNVEANRRYRMLISENFNDIKGNTPWFANAMLDNEQEQPKEKTEKDEMEAMLDLFKLHRIPMDTKTIQNELQLKGSSYTNNLLKVLYSRGEIVKVSVNHVDHSRASICYWALNLQDVKEFMECE